MGASREVITMYDEPMWASVRERQMRLQCCASCGRWRYPPAPVCPQCLSMDAQWTPLSGRGIILSWVIFHRKYFDDYEPPYNAIAVQLAEGPIVVSNLVGQLPQDSWIGCAVELCYEEHGATRTLPRFRLATDGEHTK
jgi:uncharacterized OB-fold protein